ncbi:hypothetical protein [Lacrimispora celerecrescens]|nr:hypothetical protein [Lacrimispora celerecrescens]
MKEVETSLAEKRRLSNLKQYKNTEVPVSAHRLEQIEELEQGKSRDIKR